MDRPCRSKTNYSQHNISPISQERSSTCVASSRGRGGPTVSQDPHVGTEELSQSESTSSQPRYVKPSLLCLTSRAVSPNRQDSPSLMNPVPGSQNAHNLAYERSLTSGFLSRAQSPSRENEFSMSDNYSNA